MAKKKKRKIRPIGLLIVVAVLLTIIILISLLVLSLIKPKEKVVEPTPTPTVEAVSTPEPTEEPITTPDLSNVKVISCAGEDIIVGACTDSDIANGARGGMGGSYVSLEDSTNYMVILNKTHYTTDTLTNVVTVSGTPTRLLPEAASAAEEFIQAISALGYTPLVKSTNSGYRDANGSYGPSGICEIFTKAMPGYSDHSTGLSIDIELAGHGDEQWMGTNENSSALTWWKDPAIKQVQALATSYGFVIRYPWGMDAQLVTGYGAEYWHFRYVGSEEVAKTYLTNGIDSDGDGHYDDCDGDYCIFNTLEKSINEGGYYECQIQ